MPRDPNERGIGERLLGPLLQINQNNQPPPETQTAKPDPEFPPVSWTGPILAMHLTIGTAVWHYLLPVGSSISDSFYFAVVTFLTIGYGDVHPASALAKVFFIIYVMLSLVVQFTVISSFLSTSLSLRESGETERFGAGDNIGVHLKIIPRIRAALKGVAILFGIISSGACLLHFVEQEPWLDSFYWALTTFSTVGYGDIVPHHAKALFAAYFLGAVITFTFVLGECVSIMVEVARSRRLAKMFEKGLSEDLLDRMDAFETGEVSRAEFMMFMLQQLGLVDKTELDNVLEMFDAVDTNGDGVLDITDVRRRIRESRANSTAGGTPRSAAGPSEV